MSKERPSDRAVQTGSSTRPVEEKLRIVMAAAALGPDELGALLRREGVHAAELEQSREAVVDGANSALQGGAARSSSRGADTKRIKELSLAARSTRRFPASIGPPSCAAPSTWTSRTAPGAQGA